MRPRPGCHSVPVHAVFFSCSQITNAMSAVRCQSRARATFSLLSPGKQPCGHGQLRFRMTSSRQRPRHGRRRTSAIRTVMPAISVEGTDVGRNVAPRIHTRKYVATLPSVTPSLTNLQPDEGVIGIRTSWSHVRRRVVRACGCNGRWKDLPPPPLRVPDVQVRSVRTRQTGCDSRNSTVS